MNAPRPHWMGLRVLWLLIHGLFHLTLWTAHGMQLDSAAMIDIVLVSICLVCALQSHNGYPNLMLKPRRIAVFIAGLTTAAALMLVVDRVGSIACGTLFVGIALLAKIWLKRSRLDLVLSVGLAAISVLAWVGTFYYVISTLGIG